MSNIIPLFYDLRSDFILKSIRILTEDSFTKTGTRCNCIIESQGDKNLIVKFKIKTCNRIKYDHCTHLQLYKLYNKSLHFLQDKPMDIGIET